VNARAGIEVFASKSIYTIYGPIDMQRLLTLLCLSVALPLFQQDAVAQSNESPVTDIAGIEVGGPFTAAEPVLRELGCSLVSNISIDDADAYRLADRYDVEAVRKIQEWQLRPPFPPYDGLPSLLKQVYRCSDNQLILMATEHDQPKRIGSVGLVYCALDEEEGAKPIYDKVGSRRMANGAPGIGPFDIFFPKAVSGDRLQQTSGRLSKRFPDHIYATAYKKPDACKVDFRPGGYLFGLTMASKPVFVAAKERNLKYRQRKLDSMKVTPKL
jgi:hypothetical protein